MTDLAEAAESSGPRFVTRALSDPMYAMERNGPPNRKLSLPFHPTAYPKEKLPAGFPVPPLENTFKGLLQAPRPVGDAPSVQDQLRNIATYSWLNVLLVFIPISWAAVSDFPLILTVSCRQAAQAHIASPTPRDPPSCVPCVLATFSRGHTSLFPPPSLYASLY